jgi:transcriptional regulator with XRE-family HTH domain
MVSRMADDIRFIVAASIRAEMARQSLDQRTLAARIGVSQTWVQYRTSGKVVCDVEDLVKLAEALGVPVSTLMPAESAA